jgi:4-amino-4-deoxy-L-arabinose transferase-like glycosyltransferase
MHYLPEVVLFVVLIVALVLVGWWNANPKRSTLENSLVPGSALLGASAIVLWVHGQTFGLRHLVWPVLVSLLCWALLPLGVTFQEKRQHIATHARSLFDGVRHLRGLNLWLVLYLLFIFVLTFVLTLAPPSGGDYDSLVYHLAAPQQYLREGRIIELPYDHHTYFPFLMEMMYLFGLALHGPVLAKLFHWLMLPISCAALITMGQQHLSIRAGLLAAALFASLPVVQAEASTAYIDLGLTAFSLLAFLCFANWLTSRDWWWLAWVGVFCGFCLGTKYLGVLTFGWLLLWAVGSTVKTKDFGPQQLKTLIAFTTLALVLGAGWYVRNGLWTGNPVFPFAYEIFDGKGWTAEMAKAYTRDQLEYGFGRAPLDWLWLPWRLSMSPLNVGVAAGKVVGLPFWPFMGVPLDNGANGRFEVLGLILQSVIGPALLAFSVPLLAIRGKPRIVGFMLWSFAFFVVFWAATGQYVRYLIPAFALLCLACGWGVQKYLGRSPILKWTTAAALVAWLAVTPALTLWSARSTLPVIAGRETPENYLTRTFAGYEAMHWASIQTPVTARFAVYGEPRDFYLQRDYFWADDMHNNLIDYGKIRSGEDLTRALRQLGATHVLWNTVPGRNGGVGGPPPQIEDAITRGYMRLLFPVNSNTSEGRGYRVYEITTGSEAAP